MQPDNIKNINYKVHAGQLFIPLLNGLEIKESEFPQMILLASTDSLVEQFVSEGYVKEEDYENKLETLINEAKEYMKEKECIDVDKNYFYIKDYSNGIFKYKLYIQDIVMEVNGEKRINRMLNAFFIEPRMSDLYQISLSAGPFSLEESKILLQKFDLENDEVSIKLYELMKVILDNLRYN